jgi:hypothetical protein
MSCSSSSNIVSTNMSVDIRRIGSKILAIIPLTPADGSYTTESGITGGDVIRYDVSDESAKKYVKSQANALNKAEVIGVVESVSDSSMSVVIFGQIQFPAEKFVDEGTPEGASGGNDIYFLSPTTAGAVTSLAPSEPTQVVKPILQRADDGVNNAIVLNYIGYVIGGEIIADDPEEILTSIIEFVDVGQTLPGNVIKVSDNSKTLNVSDYPDLYAKIGKKFGYTEKITFDSDSTIPSTFVGKRLTQKTGTTTSYNSRVSSVDTVTNSVLVSRGFSAEQVDTTKNILVDNIEYTPSTTEITQFNLPKITRSNSTQITVDGSSTTAKISLAMVVKSDRGVNIPGTVSVDNLTVNKKLTTSTNSASTLTDINNTVNTHETDIANIKTKLGLS